MALARSFAPHKGRKDACTTPVISPWVSKDTHRISSSQMDDRVIMMEPHLQRALLHEANFSHYHRGYSGYIVPCSGVDCHVPVFVIALACIGVLLVTFVVSAFVYTRVQSKRAFRKGEVPAGMLLGGTRFGTGAHVSIKEEKDKFMFYVRKKVQNRSVQVESPPEDEDGCPVCLKAHKDVRVWIVLQCSHELCERCFNRIVYRSRLHSTCPLCRKFLAEDIVGDGDRGPVPAIQVTNVVSRRASGQQTVDEDPETV